MQRFKASLDITAKMVTIAVCIVIIIPFIYIWEYFMASKDYRMLIAPIVIIVAIAMTALWKPSTYILSEEGLEIHRLIGTRKFSFATLVTAVPAIKEEMGTGVRTFNSGGTFGYNGKFWYSKLKTVTMYVTDRSKMILITLAGDKKIMVSPDEPVLFLKAFHQLKR